MRRSADSQRLLLVGLGGPGAVATRWYCVVLTWLCVVAKIATAPAGPAISKPSAQQTQRFRLIGVSSDLTLSPLPDNPVPLGPLLLVIADGVGVAPPGDSNAVTRAATTTLDALTASPFAIEIAAHGTAVGLPSDEDMGNSEVGHNALGAGRIFAQGAKLVNQAIASGSLFETEVWTQAIAAVCPNAGSTSAGSTSAVSTSAGLHFIGLHSDGNVHSHTDHLYRLIEEAASSGVKKVRVHILLDGRDVDPRSALSYIARTEEVLAKINAADPSNDYSIASGGGRMTITMDRYGADWSMVERGYNCHTHGVGRSFSSAAEAVETMYAESDSGDQYLEPFVVVASHGPQEGEPVGTMADGDAVILFNFRGDRAIEISQAYEDTNFDHFDRGNNPQVLFAGMLQYDGDALVPKRYLVDPPSIDRTISEYLCQAQVTSFAISETQKFGHVTYFWNGNRSGYIDESLETYVEIPSDNVEFNTTPAMKVREITEKTIELLRSGQYRFGRLNFPSGDMVGHTGDLSATIEAMEIIDECLAELVAVIEELGGVLVFTADHGNADIMYKTVNGERIPVTSHTLSPVAFAIHDSRHTCSDAHSSEALYRDALYRMADLEDPGLGNVAATLLNLLGYSAPVGYLPSLITFDTALSE